MVTASESTQIFRRVIDPEHGGFSHELAKFVMDLDFPRPDHERYEELSAKAREGRLTDSEAGELDGYLHVDSLLAILRLKAEKSLRS